MRKVYYIVIALLISVVHIFILNMWLGDAEFRSHNELSFEDREPSVIADSLKLSAERPVLKTSTDTEVAHSLKSAQ